MSEPHPGLFDAQALAVARAQADDSPWRRLALGEDAAARGLRAAVERGFALAGSSRKALRKGLMHERWGQHVGALAHLLTLGLFEHEGYAVRCEPSLGGKSPDLVARRNGLSLLVEVRAITGCGQAPWERDEEDDGDPSGIEARARDAALRHLADLGRGESGGPLPSARRTPATGHLPRGNHAGLGGDARSRARRRAAERTAAERTLRRDLRASVARAIEHKAARYEQLCAGGELPYLIAVYEDSDSRLSGIVADWAYGDDERAREAGEVSAQARRPDGGAFAADRDRLGHVSAVLVFGRAEAPGGRLLLRGDVLHNPYAQQPLPAATSFPDLRECRLRTSPAPPHMAFEPQEAPPFALVATP